MIHVLFVCLGNICRSPMAEAIFRHQLVDEGLDGKITVDSAGTAGWHTGNPPHDGTRKKLDEYNISYAGMKARQIDENDFMNFDYIITMDEKNVTSLETDFKEAKENPTICRLMDFVDNPQEKNVPDPYYTGDFNYTYTLVSEACHALLAFLKEKHHI